mmetsp:Transcript_32160/g.44078  ORF Transcript_32160/g.44078 Transcript_32160/m.44078 type:complete len:152 (+) Transcript_32160:68-523(+)|eukprot:CAMPEP_0201480106 /NCGR_PEP_ID=MMETSP0151_2-20130828/4668_1 /ASSEMBLY_ACC=CAM_ASM_000257 /TAXON_ID=200890 /ORGANISM="Paramoeba atlantica, Strain 621/1 / CCAP 1560/9" /LENGTH=151 /DNA_ID=CAMNT_0047861863 /DNA_START=32 /DNA_END=487 /DNA_ORIENTATION=+
MKSLTLLKCRYKPLSPLGAFEFSSVSSVHLLARRSIVHSYTASDPDPFELSKNEIVVLDFSAQWCGPCKAVVPQYKILSEQYPMAKFYSADVDSNSIIAKKFSVRAVPTFVVLHKEKIVERIEGAAITAVKDALDKLTQTSTEKDGNSQPN